MKQKPLPDHPSSAALPIPLRGEAALQEDDAMDLVQKMCVPCEGGVPPLAPERIAELLVQIPDWKTNENLAMLSRRYRFADFVQTMAFVNQMAALAEEQGHHPDFCVRYDVLDVQLATHAIGGLSENDFIMAAKLEALASSSSK